MFPLRKKYLKDRESVQYILRKMIITVAVVIVTEVQVVALAVAVASKKYSCLDLAPGPGTIANTITGLKV